MVQHHAFINFIRSFTFGVKYGEVRIELSMINYISSMSSHCTYHLLYSDRIVIMSVFHITIGCIKHAARNCSEKKWIIISWVERGKGLKNVLETREKNSSSSVTIVFMALIEHSCQLTEAELDINLNYALRSHLPVLSRFRATIDDAESRENCCTGSKRE